MSDPFQRLSPDQVATYYVLRELLETERKYNQDLKIRQVTRPPKPFTVPFLVL